MIKIYSEYEIKRLETYYNFLTQKRENEDWIKDCFNEIINFVIKNKRIIYGGYCYLLNIEQKDNKFDKKFNDIDIYTASPKNDINALIDIFKLKPYCWKARGNPAKHSGTYTLCINDRKISDITFIQFNYFKIIPIIKLKNELRICNVNSIYLDFFSILSDIESSFVFTKVLNRLSILQSYYPFQNIRQPFSDLVTFTNNIYLDRLIKFIQTFDSTITSLYDYKTGVNNSVTNYITINDFSLPKIKLDLDPKFVDRNGLITFMKYTEYTNNYFVSGLFAYNMYMNKFKSDNIIDEIEYIDLYVNNINDTIEQIKTKLITNKEDLKIVQSLDWPNHFDASVKVYLINKTTETHIFNLYEISKKRSYNIFNDINLSSFTFLLSFLCLEMCIMNKDQYKLYTKCIYNLLELKRNYILDDIFIPINYINNLGISESQQIVNDSINETPNTTDKLIDQAKEIKTKEIKTNDDININFITTQRVYES